MFSYGVEWDSKFREIRNPLETISGFIKNVSYVNPFAADLVGNSKFVSHIGLGARQSAALELEASPGWVLSRF